VKGLGNSAGVGTVEEKMSPLAKGTQRKRALCPHNNKKLLCQGEGCCRDRRGDTITVSKRKSHRFPLASIGV